MEAEVIRMVVNLFNGGSNACGVSLQLNFQHFILITVNYYPSQQLVEAQSQFCSHAKLIVTMVAKLMALSVPTWSFP
jgi:hypothetical protein